MTRFSLVSLALVLASFIMFSSNDAKACDRCSQVTWAQLCAQKLVNNGYGGSVGNMCQVINSGPALQCVSSLVDNGYTRITQAVINACSWTTECGATAVQAMFRNHYTVTSDFVRTVASTNSWGQARCFATVFNRRYSNLTSQNIVGLCP